MKKLLIAALVCVNVCLLLVLIAGEGFHRKAEAQPLAGALLQNNYIMLTGQIQQNNDAVYVIDMANRRLVAWQFDGSTKRLSKMGVRNLRTDLSSR